MRPTFMGFESATRGIMAQQKALDIVGNNVGNIGVTGYTRQRVDMVSLANNSASGRFAQNPVGTAGQGVSVTGISQIRDPFLDRRFREEYADVGYYQTTNNILTDLVNAIDEIEPSNMSEAIANFKNSWLNLQKNGGKDPVTSNTILASARTLTQVFKQMDSKIESIWAQQKYDLEINVNEVNSIAERIANLNDTISKEMFAMRAGGSKTSMPNELLDARNVLIDQLSNYGDITTKTNEDGTVSITMGMDQHLIVDGKVADKISITQPRGEQVVKLSWDSTGKEITTSSGAMRGAVDMLNGRGTAAQPARGETFDKGILYYKDKIDVFAKTMADEFNNIITEYDANKLPIGTKQLFVFTGDGEKNAKNLTINTKWEENPQYIIENVHPDGEGADSTAFAERVYNLFSKDMSFGGEFKGTFDGYISFYSVANLGNQVTNSGSRLQSCSDITEKILDNISAVSGVSMEEEGIDMVQYTKAYNAMGRVMTALDEALDTLINKVGLVGR